MPADPVGFALDHYNAVVKAIKLLNLGTGYGLPAGEIDAYFTPLFVSATATGTAT